MPKGISEVGGQLVLDRPHHCSLCRRRYFRRHLLMIWERIIVKGETRLRMTVVRLCADDPSSKTGAEIRGCYEMGLARVFARAKIRNPKWDRGARR